MGDTIAKGFKTKICQNVRIFLNHLAGISGIAGIFGTQGCFICLKVVDFFYDLILLSLRKTLTQV